MFELPPTSHQIRMNKLNAFAEISNPLGFLKILAVYVVIVIAALIPVIVGFGGMYMQEIITGRRAHEGNSIFGAVPWLALITFPLGFGFLVFWTIILVKSNLAFFKKRK